MTSPTVSLQNTKAVLFDLYGTLLDIVVDEHSETFWNSLSDELLDSKGLRLEPGSLEAEFREICASVGDQYPHGQILDRAFPEWARSLSLKGSPTSSGDLAQKFRRLSRRTFGLRPYTTPLIGILRRSGLVVSLVSNTEALLTNVDLHDCGLSDSFDNVLFSSEIGIEKPDPRILRLALKRVAVSPNEAIFVGDTWSADIIGAQAVPMRAVWLRAASWSDRDPLEILGLVVKSFPTLGSILAALEAADKISLDSTSEG